MRISILLCACLLTASPSLATPRNAVTFTPVTFTPLTRLPANPAPALRGSPPDFLSGLNDRARMEAAVAEQLRRNPPPLTVPQRAVVQIAYLTKQIAADPEDAALFNQRCFMRGLTRRDLDAALADCDKALSLRPGTAAFLDRRALILYLQGQYRDALTAYDTVLERDPYYAASLLIRGYVKDRLGDAAGRDADIAAAQIANPGILKEFIRLGIIAPPN